MRELEKSVCQIGWYIVAFDLWHMTQVWANLEEETFTSGQNPIIDSPVWQKFCHPIIL